MDQGSKQKTLDNLTKAETILVSVSQNANFDALAAGLALYLSCIKLGKNATIKAKNPSVGEAQKLYGVDKIGHFEGSKNLIVVVNDAIDNVDKVTYSLEDTRLKIVVHPFPGAKNVTREQISFDETPTKPNFIFAVGYQNAEELNQIVAHEQNLDPDVWIVNISKGDMGQIIAQVNVFNNQAASICEVAGLLFQELALPVDEDVAYNLYAGVTEATGNFSPAKTSQLSLETASWLLKFGAGKASFAKPTGFAPGNVPQPTQNQSLPFAPLDQMPQMRQNFPPEDFPQEQFPTPDPFDQPAIEQVERPRALSAIEGKAGGQDNWLKPPKVYKGSKSFDSEK